MTDRSELCADFLASSPCAGWAAKPLAGDASNRSYQRLTGPDSRTAVLMDAPPEKGEDTRPFVHIAKYLRSQGLSAPEIFDQDVKNGFLLIEDLGDDQFSRVIKADRKKQMPLYAAATDVLVALHQASFPELDPLGPRTMAEMAGLVFEKYRGGILGETDSALQKRFEDQFEDILRQAVKGPPVFVHRDYHAENLLWLPDREGLAKVGIIDFQDARSGHPAYDLVSLLQDARRDVPAGVEMQMIDRYIAAAGVDDSTFRTAYAVIGVQRHLRILGVFARLSLDFGRSDYLKYIPRVWAHFEHGLDHPVMANVADLLRQNLPSPTAENLNKLRP